MIAAVVVLYNPNESIAENISSYIDNVDKLYIVDNSEEKNHTLLNKLHSNPKIQYVDNQGNKGIAYALNVAADLALKDQYDYLLTMDQDSMATDTMVQALLSYITERTNVAVIAPYHANKFSPVFKTAEDLSEVTTTMTSGNLLNLHLFKTIGPFTESLFIDFVDHDYCLRALQHGYKVLQVNNAILKHNLGDLRQHKFLNFTFHSTNHPPVRKYYVFRNRAYIIQKYKTAYPEFCQREFRRFFTDIFVVIFYEKEKLHKLQMMLRGLKDFFSGKMGAYDR